MSKTFLGIDASTQSLTGVAVDVDRRRVVATEKVLFDRDLPAYGTRNGVLPNADPRIVHAPPLLWVEALERLFDRLGRRLDSGSVAALALSGQQHGSVYLREGWDEAVARLDAGLPLAGQVAPWLARDTAPVWMDSSTSAECAEIRQRLGGRLAATRLTGSDVYERFTGPQIRRFAKLEPGAWEETAHVALVSSFLTSILAGAVAPIDHGDGSGMSLMDLARREWSGAALDATADRLAHRLPSLAAPDEVLPGGVAPFFVERFGLSSDTRLLPGTGDNPSTAVGVGLVEPGPLAVSLGTSDTCFALLDEVRTDPEGLGHVFVSGSGRPMPLICFHNGSLAREAVRDRFGLDWRGFSEALASTEPGNGGRLLLPWFEPEIVPRVAVPGARRIGGLEEDDAAANCRAVVEGQMLSMRLHSRWVDERPPVLLATGGGSENRQILQVMASVFGAPVLRFEISDGAALGAALRAAYGWHREEGGEVGWQEIVAGFTDPLEDSRIEPEAGAVQVYAEALERYREHERRALEEIGDLDLPSS